MRKVALLVLATALNVHAENVTDFESEQIKSLNEVKTLQIFGDLITIEVKNVTQPDPEGDAFVGYLRNHLIRIQSPLENDKHLDFQLDHLIPENEAEGRQKKRKGPIRDVLIPLLLMIKHKLSFALPLFLAMVTFVAFKGFWAGMSGLVISKVIGLKLLLQSQNKQDEDKDNNEDQEEDQENSEHEENEKPVVVYLNSHSHRRRIFNRRHRPAEKRYYGPESWKSWGRQWDFEKLNKGGNRLSLNREPWNQINNKKDRK